MATAANVLSLFMHHPRESCLIAVSDAVRTIEFKEPLDLDDIARKVGCSRSSIKNAKYKKTLLEFDCIAMLLASWPQHCEGIRSLWEMQPSEPETPEEERRRLIRRLADLEDAIARTADETARFVTPSADIHFPFREQAS